VNDNKNMLLAITTAAPPIAVGTPQRSTWRELLNALQQVAGLETGR